MREQESKINPTETAESDDTLSTLLAIQQDSLGKLQRQAEEIKLQKTTQSLDNPTNLPK